MYKPLRNCKNDYIWYSQKPLRLGGIPQKISIDDFMNIFYVPQGGERFEYTETLWYPQDMSRQKWGRSVYDSPIAKALMPEVLKYIENPSTNKMVISFIDEEVGFGVFAREKIAYGEVVAIYSGIILNKSELINKTYALGGEDYSIDAAKKGGIARFFQELPNVRKHEENFNEIVSQDFDLLIKFLTLEGHTQQLREADDRKNRLKLMGHTSSFVPDGWRIKPEVMNRERLFWLIDSIQFSDKSMEDNIASLNLGKLEIIDPETGLPFYFFYAERNIEIGEQLGISYGWQYWCHNLPLKKLPKLFDLKGKLTSAHQYQYIRWPVHDVLSTIDTRTNELKIGDDKIFCITKKDIDCNIEVQAPIKGIRSFSFFEMRDKLSLNGILPLSYGAIPDNGFVAQLRNDLLEIINFCVMISPIKAEITCKLYWHNPEAVDYLERQTADVGCYFISNQTGISYSTIKNVIQQFKEIAPWCKFHDECREIIILGVNLPERASVFQKFSRELLPYFKKEFASTTPRTLMQQHGFA